MKINSNIFSNNSRIISALIFGKIPRYVLDMFWKQANGSLKSLVLNWNEYVDAIRTFVNLGPREDLLNEHHCVSSKYWLAILPNTLDEMKKHAVKCLVHKAAFHMHAKEMELPYESGNARRDFKELLYSAKVLDLISKDDEGHSYYTQGEALVPELNESYRNNPPLGHFPVKAV